jgi:hypothetical protein
MFAPTVSVAAVLGMPALTARAQEPVVASDTAPKPRKVLLKAAAYGSAYYGGALYLLSKTWYKDRARVPFHFYDDRGAYQQVDKVGHAFGASIYSYVGYHTLLRAGLTRNEALAFGATAGVVLQTPVELMDGIHEGYGFSWADMAANSLGSAFVLGQELVFNEQVAKLKFSYWESPYARKANGFLGESSLDRFFSDYNGQTYWLSAPLNRLIRRGAIAPWMNVAVGYGAGGMYGERANITSFRGVPIPQTTRYRQWFLSLDVDWTRIETKSRTLDGVLQGLTFIKLPFPTIEYTSTGRLRAHWLYF